MSKTRGLDELVSNQEKNSTPSKRYRLINGTLKSIFSQAPIYWGETLSASRMGQGGNF